LANRFSAKTCSLCDIETVYIYTCRPVVGCK